MVPPALNRMTAEEFYRWPGANGARYELVDGVPVRAMTGASQRHDIITLNVLSSLRRKLRGAPCRAHTADIAVATLSGNIRRPGALVNCGPRIDTAFEASEPRLVMEVLSPSTRQTDLVRKLEEYKALPSLAYIVLIEPELPSVLLWRREASGGWELAAFDGLEHIIALPALGIELPMAELYEDVVFAEPLAGEGVLR